MSAGCDQRLVPRVTVAVADSEAYREVDRECDDHDKEYRHDRHPRPPSAVHVISVHTDTVAAQGVSVIGGCPDLPVRAIPRVGLNGV